MDRNVTVKRLDDVDNVALRKESVDRNFVQMLSYTIGRVALRKESVDRNYKEVRSMQAIFCRSPQGERG